MNYKYSILALLLSTFLVPTANATITTAEQEDKKIDTSKHELVPVKILADYRKFGYTGVMDLGTYTKIDDDKILAFINDRFDGYNKKKGEPGGCTSYIKKIKEGDEDVVVMGRNMDLPNSLYGAYVFKIDEPGRYKSINIGYTGSGIETFEQIANDKAMVKEMHDVLPYMITDSLNEKGLRLETNIRNATDKVKMTGTNPGKKRIPDTFLLRYLSDHAANIEEALKVLNDIDVYSPDSVYTRWHSAIAMVDADGRYGVLEFVDNKPVWHEGQKGHANFWIDKGAYEKTDSNTGMGRYKAVALLDDHINSEEIMSGAMQNIWYSQLFAVDTDKMSFDSCSEEAGAVVQDELNKVKGWQEKYNIKVDESEWNTVQNFANEWQYPIPSSFCEDSDKKAKVDALTNLITHSFQQLPAKVKQTSGLQEVSTISYVINNKDNIYHVRFFEQPEIFDYSFDGIKKE